MGKSKMVHASRLLMLVVAVYLTAVWRPASAFEVDTHHHLTFAMALSVGWDWRHAAIIAAADQALDENKATVAALGTSTLFTGPIEQNYVFHCFSRKNDKQNAKRGQPNGDVIINIKDLAARAFRRLEKWRGLSARERTEALVALGVFLHCQEDSWSHLGFGGERDGHALESAYDNIERAWPSSTEPRRHNPDHPALRPDLTEIMIFEKLKILEDGKRATGKRPAKLKGGRRKHLAIVSGDPKMLKLRNGARRRCVQILAEHWLYGVLLDQRRLKSIPQRFIIEFQADRAAFRPWKESCEKIHREYFRRRHKEFRIAVPPFRFPRLDIRGEPYTNSIRDDGRYLGTASGDFDIVLETVKIRLARRSGDVCTYQVNALVRNTGDKPSPDFTVVALLIPSDTSREIETLTIPREKERIIGTAIDRKSLSPGENNIVEVKQTFQAECVADGIVWGDIRPNPGYPLAELFWSDANIHNDRLLGRFKDE
jgi:hypothetical protein